MEAIRQQKASRRPDYPLSLTNKERRHMHALFFLIIGVNKIIDLNIGF